jgi:hypothetical protein
MPAMADAVEVAGFSSLLLAMLEQGDDSSTSD